MRDRLIELIGSKVCGDYSPSCDEWQPHSCEKCYANDCRIGELADSLLANGVIVPPVRVGQTVYVIIKNKVIEKEIAKIEVSTVGVWFAWRWRGCGYEMFNESDVGKTVFLTREEAEAALKGGADNEQRKAD